MTSAARKWMFQPWFVLAVALIAAVVFAMWVALTAQGERRDFMLIYFTPIGVPFIAFLFDRVEHRAEMRPLRFAIDVPVIVLALARAVTYVPLVSGHALFLTYAFFTTRSRLVRISAILVMLEVVYFKVFVWGDVALIGGIVVGCATAWLFNKTSRA